MRLEDSQKFPMASLMYGQRLPSSTLDALLHTHLVIVEHLHADYGKNNINFRTQGWSFGIQLFIGGKSFLLGSRPEVSQ